MFHISGKLLCDNNERQLHIVVAVPSLWGLMLESSSINAFTRQSKDWKRGLCTNVCSSVKGIPVR